ncbi:hypothetical protein SDC9_117902 [bioreactor metagenome]|uniref:Uncharacterized protein n=1 Tax=bioreactor metagenome TaxID=1076179 RepID=A0A645BZJ4_9ZZZZ
MPQGWIDLLDAAVAVADDQDVRHRGEHALDELMRLFECGILLLEGDFVLQEVVIDLVHLLDHLDPGLLAGRGEQRVSGWDGSGHGRCPARRGRGGIRPPAPPG